MKLSIVTTMFKSELTIAEFIRRASVAAAQITDSFEIIVVDDGSPDKVFGDCNRTGHGRSAAQDCGVVAQFRPPQSFNDRLEACVRQFLSADR